MAFLPAMKLKSIIRWLRLSRLGYQSNLPEIFISYKWNDNEHRDREHIVEQFCLATAKQGISVIRDTTNLQLGEQISSFMRRLGNSQRVIVILSDGYLKSANCMFELHEIWLNCRGLSSQANTEEFSRRIKVFRLADVNIAQLSERLEYAKYWEERAEKLQQLVKDNLGLVGSEDFNQLKIVSQFYHNITNILYVINNTLTPQNIDQLLEYGLADLNFDQG